MIDSYLRDRVQFTAISPVASALAWIGVTHNMVTGAALALGLLIPLALATGHVYLAILCLFVSGYLDTLDGTIARLTGQDTPAGCVFDIVSDRAVEAGVIIGLFLVDPVSRGLLCLLMMASVLICITSFLVVGIFSNNESEKSFHYSPGIMERTEAFLFFMLMILFPGHFALFSILFSALVFATGAIRVLQFGLRKGGQG